MPISSMTGFARQEGSNDTWRWAWELRSVNNRGLDVRLRLPPALDRLDPALRGRINKRFKRGSINGGLQLHRIGGKGEIAINRQALAQVLALQRELDGQVEQALPRLEGLLAVRGVVEVAEAEDSDEAQAGLEASILTDFDAALKALAAARAEEGARLGDILAAQIAEIDGLVAQAQATAEAQPDRLRARVANQIALLMEAQPPLSEDRLAQEVAMLASRADVREETDRLAAHVAAARDLLDSDEPFGRRLDFLCQEFNREANTLCSKAQDLDLTNIGLSLKAVIEQFREQVQNVE